MSEGRRVALALGSGGARGYAHIGTIQVLEERGYEIVAVAGTSMGAVIGGLYAAGRLDTYVAWVSSLSQRDVWRLLDPAVNGPGAIRAERVMGRVAEILDGALIEDLAIPFTAVATDLDLRREVWFQRGPVHTAMRASVAIPRSALRSRTQPATCSGLPCWICRRIVGRLRSDRGGLALGPARRVGRRRGEFAESGQIGRDLIPGAHRSGPRALHAPHGAHRRKGGR